MFESKLNKGKIGGYAGLDSTGKILIENSNQNNFSREINICEEDLIGSGTIEEKLLAYLLSIDYKKSIFDGEVMIIVRTCSSGGSGGSGGDIWSMGIGLELLE
jgi:hypothetical protein